MAKELEKLFEMVADNLDLLIEQGTEFDTDLFREICEKNGFDLDKYIEAEKNRPGRFRDMKNESVKVCKIINTQLTWILEVDGESLGFTGSSHAEYFANHYEELGYVIETENWNREK